MARLGVDALDDALPREEHLLTGEADRETESLLLFPPLPLPNFPLPPPLPLGILATASLGSCEKAHLSPRRQEPLPRLKKAQPSLRPSLLAVLIPGLALRPELRPRRLRSVGLGVSARSVVLLLALLLSSIPAGKAGG